MSQVKSVTPFQLNQLIASNTEIRIVDVRSASEYKEKHIPGAEHFPIDKIESGVFKSDSTETIITACGSGGGRSVRSAEIISEKLNRPVYFLEGGTFAWFRHSGRTQFENTTALQRFLKIVHLPNDSEEEKLRKSTLLLLSFPFAMIGILWGILYFSNNLSVSGWIPFTYGVLSLLSIVHFIVTKKFRVFRFSQVLLILLLPFLLQISLGGFVPSSAVIIWAVISPLGALTLYDPKFSMWWFAGYVVVVVAAFILNNYLPEFIHHEISETFINWFFLLNILGVSGLIYFMLFFFARTQRELKRAVEKQNVKIAESNKSITDSITYARRIQLTLLAHDDVLKNNLNDYFILFKPKDIVSGDFYWATKRGGRFYLAVCDSTGHGVPGAFMSVLNISLLNEAINEKGLTEPHQICNHVRHRLIESVSQDGGQDGMDGVLICIDQGKNTITYAAAHNSPFLVSGNTGKFLDADKMPIGKGEDNNEFRLVHIEMKKGDTLYLFTDGIADQFGGPRGKKFKTRQLQELLTSLQDVSLQEQQKIIGDIITEWMGEEEQTDDMLLVGIRL